MNKPSDYTINSLAQGGCDRKNEMNEKRINRRNLATFLIVCAGLVSVSTGCNEKDDPANYQPRLGTASGGTNREFNASSPSVAPQNTNRYPRVRGKWSGSFYRTDKPDRTSISANVQQDRDAVIITTTKPAGTAVNLTGTIYPSGRMVLFDAFDGEKWTTYFGPANENRMVIADFVYPPGSGASNKPLYVIELTR